MAIIITWLLAIWFATKTADNKLTWHNVDKKKDGNSEMSIYTCSVIKNKKNTNLAGNYILKEALSKYMKMYLHQTTSSHYLHSSDPWKQDKSWRQILSSRVRQETEAATFSALMLTDLDELDKLNYGKLWTLFSHCFDNTLVDVRNCLAERLQVWLTVSVWVWAGVGMSLRGFFPRTLASSVSVSAW